MKPFPYLQSVRVRDDAKQDADTYPFSLAPVQQIERIKFHENVTFLVGENGSGKSTILEALALASGFGVEGGTKNVQLNSGDHVSNLSDSLRLAGGLTKPRDGYYLRAESFYNVATYMDSIGYLEGYGGQSLHTRSHGEAFLILLTQKLRGQGLYFLDEPEAALSPMRQLAAVVAIDALVKKQSQFVIATHSPILLAYPHATTYWFDAEGIREIKYEDIEHVRTVADFMRDPRKRIAQLLAEAPSTAKNADERTFGPF